MIFTIKEGNHFSDQLCFKLSNIFNFSGSQAFTVTFTDSCAYKLESKQDQEDINKLFGFSCGWHHKNSARFGWSFVNRKIQLWAYYYNNSRRSYTHITSLDFNKPYQLRLTALESCYEFIVDSDYVAVALLKVPRRGRKTIGYNLWPFFGGNNPAPHDIKINLEPIY